jgi:hypothetical protein
MKKAPAGAFFPIKQIKEDSIELFFVDKAEKVMRC